jgi:hypothetical protein
VLVVVSLLAACATEKGPTPLALAGATIDLPPDEVAGDPNERSNEPDASGASASEPGSASGGALPTTPPERLTCPKDRWCSALYPPSWTPAAAPDSEGRFLHDFSYAGYRNGEAPPTTLKGATYDVVTAYGADATGQSDATSAVQTAINAASSAGGGIVFFRAGIYRIDQLLAVTTSGVVLRGVGKSSLLRFTKASGMANKANLTFSGAVTRSAARSLAVDAPARAKEIFLADATGLVPGDDVAVGWTISPSFVSEHGMTNTWTTFAGQYKPFFRSKVVSVDTTSRPHRVVLDVPLRYPAKMRDGAGLQRETGYLREVGMEHLGVSTGVTWTAAWAENRVNAITLRDVADAWVTDVHSMPASGATGRSSTDKTPYHLRSGGILIENAKRVSVLGASMAYPQNRGSGGNGYLYEVSRTSEVLFADSEGRSGRHNFIQNWGFGNSGTVFLRCTSVGSEMLSLIGGVLTPEPSQSEHHHSLSMATLVDRCRLDDGFLSENRGAYSDGAGHSATQSVAWGSFGTGKITSKQFGWGYVIGTQGVEIDTSVASPTGQGTGPEDYVEGRNSGATLYPASLYEDQRARRLATP